jgi:hypothetical protein
MVNYYYNFALVDRETMICMEVRSTTDDESGCSDEYTLYVVIPEYNEEYIFKYYNEATGKFYYDAEMTEEFIP